MGRGELPDVLALVEPGVPDHDHGHVGCGGQGRGPVEVGPVVEPHRIGRERRSEAIGHGHHLGGPHVAGSAVPEVDGVGQCADEGDRPTGRKVQGQQRGSVDRLVP